MSLLEYEPNQALRVFYGKAVEIDQKKKLLNQIFKQDNKELKRGIPATNHPTELRILQRVRYEGMRQTVVAERQIISELDPALQPIAPKFFDLLPAIRKAVASIEERNPRPVTDFISCPVVLTEDLCKALWIAAQGTGYAMTGESSVELVIALPDTAPDEAAPFPREATY